MPTIFFLTLVTRRLQTYSLLTTYYFAQVDVAQVPTLEGAVPEPGRCCVDDPRLDRLAQRVVVEAQVPDKRLDLAAQFRGYIAPAQDTLDDPRQRRHFFCDGGWVELDMWVIERPERRRRNPREPGR